MVVVAAAMMMATIVVISERAFELLSMTVKAGVS
jgi:hypothetical protein